MSDLKLATDLAALILDLHEKALRAAEGGTDKAEEWVKLRADYVSVSSTGAAVMAAALQDLLAERDAPMSKFVKTYCSQCGGEFGPGDSGYSHCSDHWSPGVQRAMAVFEAGLAKRHADRFGLPWHVEPWGDGSKPPFVNILSNKLEIVVAADLERDIANWIVNMANATYEPPTD